MCSRDPRLYLNPANIGRWSLFLTNNRQSSALITEAVCFVSLFVYIQSCICSVKALFVFYTSVKTVLRVAIGTTKVNRMSFEWVCEGSA